MADTSSSPTLAHKLHDVLLLNAWRPFIGSIEKEEPSLNNTDTTKFTWESYQDINIRSAALASALTTEIKLARRSVVGICGINMVKWLLADFACCFNDYVSVGLHNAWDSNTMDYVIMNSGISCLFCMKSDVKSILSSLSSNHSLKT